jgi:uncharacterized protein YpuA (DUF1002 family)
MTNPASIASGAISNVAEMHLETAANIERQRQLVDQIIQDMQAQSTGDMVKACIDVHAQWDNTLLDLNTKLKDMAQRVNDAVKLYGGQDSDAGSTVAKVGHNMSALGTYLVG